MPTDEQRGRFHVWRGRYFDEIDLSLMTPMETSAYKSAFQAGLRARDAEVQALRKALSQLRDMAQLCIDRKAINPISHHAEALLLAEYLDKADAALVGGEKGTDDE